MRFLKDGSLPGVASLSKALGRPLAFVDLETTGLVHQPGFAIIEIGLILIDGSSIDERSAFVNPRIGIPKYVTELTGIDDAMVAGARDFGHFAGFFEKVAKTHVVCGFNSRSFDCPGLSKMARRFGKSAVFSNQIDVRMAFLKARNSLTGMKSMKGDLTEASRFYRVELHGSAHRAGYDIALTALLAEKLIAHHGLESMASEADKLACETSKESFRKTLRMG